LFSDDSSRLKVKRSLFVAKYAGFEIQFGLLNIGKISLNATRAERHQRFSYRSPAIPNSQFFDRCRPRVHAKRSQNSSKVVHAKVVADFSIFRLIDVTFEIIGHDSSVAAETINRTGGSQLAYQQLA